MALLVLFVISLGAGLAAFLVSLRLQPPVPRSLTVAHEVGGELHRRARLRRVVVRRLDPTVATGLALTVALLLVVAGGVVLAVLAYLVRANDTLLRLDRSVAIWGDEHALPFSRTGLEIVTTMGETWLVVVSALVLGVVETLRVRSRWVLPFLVVVIAGNNVVTHMVKALADRVRPDLDPVAATLGPSFPSGHSSTAAAFTFAAALILARRRRRGTRAVLAAAAVAITVAVAGSRVLLDVHWLSDVVAGVTLGWGWFALCAIAFGGRLLRFGAPAREVVATADDPAQGAVKSAQPTR